MSTTASPSPPRIHIIRHGESLHNIQRPYPHRDPPLTQSGHTATQQIHLPTPPDLLLISPMTGTLQTALNMFPSLQTQASPMPPVQIRPDLRETYEAECNKGSPRATLEAAFPQFDFSSCAREWDYAPYTVESATQRAERVRTRLKELAVRYPTIAVVSHRGFIAFLVKGRLFGMGERRAYRFAGEEEARERGVRMGVCCEGLGEMDFGPTVLVLEKEEKQGLITSLD